MHISSFTPCAALLLVCLQSGWLCSQTTPSSPTSGAPAKWVTFNDCPVALESRYVVPARQAGIVESVTVERNALVKRDQLLVRLESDEAAAALESAKENHAYAVDAAADDGDVKLRKLALDQAKEELASHVEISKSVSASELRKHKLNVAAAEVAVANAQRALKRQAIQARMAASAVQSASIKLANHDVHAPAEGIVTDVLVRQGEAVEFGKPVMEISDLRQLQVDCLIPIEKTDLKKLVGLEVRVESNHRTASGSPIRLAGKITSYDPKLTAHGEVRVHCRIQNVQQAGHWLLLPEMNVRLEVAVGDHANDEVPALISKRPM